MNRRRVADCDLSVAGALAEYDALATRWKPRRRGHVFREKDDLFDDRRSAEESLEPDDWQAIDERLQMADVAAVVRKGPCRQVDVARRAFGRVVRRGEIGLSLARAA